MNEPTRARYSGGDRWSALRRAALAAHWVPGVGLTVRQPGRPSVTVAGWDPGGVGHSIRLHPCAFRSLVIQAEAARALGLEGLLAGDGDVEIETITTDGSTVGSFGLIWADIEPGVRVLALPLDGDASDGQSTVDCCGDRGPEHVAVGFDHDAELGATLAHVCFDPTDVATEAQIVDRLVDLAARSSAEVLVDSVRRSEP